MFHIIEEPVRGCKGSGGALTSNGKRDQKGRDERKVNERLLRTQRGATSDERNNWELRLRIENLVLSYISIVLIEYYGLHDQYEKSNMSEGTGMF